MDIEKEGEYIVISYRICDACAQKPNISNNLSSNGVLEDVRCELCWSPLSMRYESHTSDKRETLDCIRTMLESKSREFKEALHNADIEIAICVMNRALIENTIENIDDMLSRVSYMIDEDTIKNLVVENED